MALWNDKRTPKGIVTDTHTGQNRPMSGSQHPSIGVGARYGVPMNKPEPPDDMHRPAPSSPTKPKPSAPTQQRTAEPRSTPAGKTKVDKPSNMAAAKEVAGIAKKSPGAAPALKTAASKMTKLAKKTR